MSGPSSIRGNRSRSAASLQLSPDGSASGNNVDGSEEEITITLNTGVLQTLLETTANDLLEVFKTSRQVPEQSDDEIRRKILRELNGIKRALVDSKQQSESLENESISKAQCSKPGPSTSVSSPSVSKSAVIDLTGDSEHENPKSVILSKPSHKVVQKRSREDRHLSSPPAKRACSSSPMENSKISEWFNNTAGSSSANSQDTDDAASKSISESVLRTSQQHTLSRTLSLNSATSSGNTSAESDVICVNTQANRKESIPSTSSPIGDSSSSGGSSVTFKRSCSKAGSSKSRQKSNQEPANVPNERNTTQGVQQANSKCDESSNGPQPTRNTTNSEKSTTGPSNKTCTGIILLSEKESTSEASTKQNIIDSKQSQASTSHRLPLLVSPTKGKGTGEKGSSKSTKRPSKKESNQENSTESADRKRRSRCPISMRRLCPVCSKLDCGKCKNCLNKGKRQACLEKPIKDCITYISQKRAPKHDSEIPPSSSGSVPDETILKRKRSRSSSSSEINTFSFISSNSLLQDLG